MLDFSNRMDKIGATNREYVNILRITTGIFIVIIEAYLMLIFIGIDVFNFSMVENTITQYVLQLIFQLGFFSLIFTLIYSTVKFFYSKLWIHKHKNIWIKGTWLHIHMKNEVRIGVVNIKQNFYTINANGTNFYPAELEKGTGRTTKWNYVFAKVNDDHEHNVDLIGYYRAGSAADCHTKDGVHTLDISNNNSKYFPSCMKGKFRDTTRPNVDGLDGHYGYLFMFKPSKNIMKYLTNDFTTPINEEKLKNLHNKPEFVDEDYVIRLKKCLKTIEQVN